MLRLGIIGAGGIASLHTHNILSGKCPEVQLTAMADRKESRRQWCKENLPESGFAQPCRTLRFSARAAI